WALPATAASTTPDHPADRYALVAWSRDQSGDVLSIAQDVDGYLWLGTQAGPVRFDGTRFEPWTQSGNAVTARFGQTVAASSQGGIWAVAGTGGVARIARGRVISY